MIRRSHVLPAAVLALLGGAANATVIGSAVNLSGTTIDGGSAGNPIDFYIPLSADQSGIYGVGGAGLSADSCSTAWYASDKCGGGFLGMLLEFEGVAAGSHVMTLEFDDLDLAGVNDPYYFFESLSLFSLNTTPSYDFVWSANDPLVTFADHDDQTLSLDVEALGGGDVYFGLLFGSKILSHGSFINTPESLVAKLDAIEVPEPATLSLLGAGLVAVGFAARRRRVGSKT